MDRENQNIYNLLRTKHFVLGIAEAGQLSSGFAVFYNLGIRNMIATSATPASSPFYHFLGMPMPYEVPEQNTAQHGDGFANSEIRRRGSHRQNENKEEIENLINTYIQIYEDAFFRQNSLPPLWQIITNVRYLLINHPEIVAYPRLINEKIGFIGGIAIDEQNTGKFYSKIMTHEVIETVWFEEYSFLNDVDCVVVLSFGTIVTFFGLTLNQLISIFNAFQQHPNCYFIFRADMFIQNYVNNYVHVPSNVYLFYETIDLKGILAQRNTKVAIIHCGQNSLNEALYAGVPVICIPFFGDQHYNASVVEYRNLGMWVRAPNVENEFQTAVNALLNEDYGFLARAHQFAAQLHTQQNTPEQIFLNTVRNAIDSNVPFDDSIQLGDIQFYHQE